MAALHDEAAGVLTPPVMSKCALETDGYTDEEIEYLKQVLPGLLTLIVQKMRERREANFQKLVDLFLGDAKPRRMGEPSGNS